MAERSAVDGGAAVRVHGGVDERELARFGIEPSSVVDFSVNLNPYGPPAAVLEAIRRAPVDRYPDPRALAAREAWASALDRDAAGIAVGHGAADLFWAVARALIGRDERVLIAEPTFSEFALAAAAAGARVERLFARPERDLRFDLQQVERAARGVRALYLCTPNNPTGEVLPVASVRALAQALEDTVIVLDQSFLALSDRADELRSPLPANVIAVRSLTKEFACPGLRIGLCVAAPRMIERIEAARPTWATSSLALAAIEACAREETFVRESWRRLRLDRGAVGDLLAARGFAPRASDTAFQLVPLPGAASELRRALLAHGVLVRDCASFGLPHHMRVAALPLAARARLAEALDAVLSS